jgi:NAD+ synthase (glutamine-hydrolysing)
VAERELLGSETSAVLRRVLASKVSPELVPGDARDGDGPHQSTEEQIGPYELHDFFLYALTRRGYAPSKVAFLAAHAWANDLPDAPSESPYSLDRILHWLEVFLRRFFETSQFKRSASPNGPKVGSGGSLSPRGDWRAPSDSSAAAWLDELAAAREWARRRL